jgi:hypothetical protein
LKENHACEDWKKGGKGKPCIRRHCQSWGRTWRRRWCRRLSYLCLTLPRLAQEVPKKRTAWRSCDALELSGRRDSEPKFGSSSFGALKYLGTPRRRPIRFVRRPSFMPVSRMLWAVSSVVLHSCQSPGCCGPFRPSSFIHASLQDVVVRVYGAFNAT